MLRRFHSPVSTKLVSAQQQQKTTTLYQQLRFYGHGDSHAPGKQYWPDRFRIVCYIGMCGLGLYFLKELYEMLFRGGISASGMGVHGNEQYYFGSPEQKQLEFARKVEERKRLQAEYEANKQRKLQQQQQQQK